MQWVVAGMAMAMAVGFGGMYRWKSTAGVAAEAPLRWPSGTSLAAAADRPTLVMFVHPRCVCSRASMTELARLQTGVAGRVAITVVFVRPPGVGPEFEHSDLWAAASRIPEISLRVDRDGVEAARFGAGTSGACVLYAADGHLEFEGGITALRGHEGPSAGQTRITERVRGGAGEGARAPVFGCPLVQLDPSHISTEPRP